MTNKELYEKILQVESNVREDNLIIFNKIDTLQKEFFFFKGKTLTIISIVSVIVGGVINVGLVLYKG